jgi:hypothetical protein
MGHQDTTRRGHREERTREELAHANALRLAEALFERSDLVGVELLRVGAADVPVIVVAEHEVHVAGRLALEHEDSIDDLARPVVVVVEAWIAAPRERIGRVNDVAEDDPVRLRLANELGAEDGLEASEVACVAVDVGEADQNWLAIALHTG